MLGFTILGIEMERSGRGRRRETNYGKTGQSGPCMRDYFATDFINYIGFTTRSRS
jgi:hypothetical protein